MTTSNNPSNQVATSAAHDSWPQVEAEAKTALTPEIVAKIERARAGEHTESALISVLHSVQQHFGYLGEQQLNAVAQLMRMPTSSVTGVATFYHYFRLQPVGRFAINICMGTACYVKGADRVASRFQEELGIEFGQTTRDGQFSLHNAACLGTCGLAPVVMVNERVFANVKPDNVPALIEKLQRGSEELG
jgi:NADH-quinone oxidoreductase subunit E